MDEPTMKKILFIACFCAAVSCHSQNQAGLKLWYTQPSGNTWENALPIGDGSLGAMVYGNIDTERVELNENTLWSGSPNRNDNLLALDSLTVLRDLVFGGRQKDAEEMANRIIVSKRSHGQMFEPLGELQLVFNNHHNYENYYRELDIEKAIATTSYTLGDVTYRREVLASLPDRIIVMRLSTNKPHSLSFTAFYLAALPNAEIKTTKAKQLLISGTTIDHEGVKGMIRYKGITQIKTQGGSCSVTDTSLTIENADAATIYISIATNFNNYHNISGNENERARDYLNKAISKSFSEISKAHVAAYQKFFNRVKLDLGTSDSGKFPTDERLKNFTATNDPQFVEL